MAVGVNPWSASATSTASKTRTCDGAGRCWVTTHNDEILSGMDRVDRKDIIEAAKLLFAKDRPVVVVSD